MAYIWKCIFKSTDPSDVGTLSCLLSNAERVDLYDIRKQKYQKWIIHRKLRVPMSIILSLQRYSTQQWIDKLNRAAESELRSENEFAKASTHKTWAWCSRNFYDHDSAAAHWLFLLTFLRSQVLCRPRLNIQRLQYTTGTQSRQRNMNLRGFAYCE